MKSKEDIIQLLFDKLDQVYCNTCRYNGDLEDENGMYPCIECHRKSMNWSISKDFAEYLTDKILEDE